MSSVGIGLGNANARFCFMQEGDVNTFSIPQAGSVNWQLMSSIEVAEMIHANITKAEQENNFHHNGLKITNAVIAVPAHLTDLQRVTIKEGGRLAGLTNVRLTNLSTAAAIAAIAHFHKKNKNEESNMLVFSQEGRNCDVSLVTASYGSVIVKRLIRFDHENEDCNEMFSESLETEIDEIILVGGSKKIPKIKTILQSLLHGQIKNTFFVSDEDVAYGACLQAARLENQDFCVFDVASFYISYKISGGGQLKKIVKKNSTLPVQHSETLRVYSGTTTIQVFEGSIDSHLMRDNIKIYSYELSGIPISHKGGPSVIKINMGVNTSGIFYLWSDSEIINVTRKAESFKANQPLQVDTAPQGAINKTSQLGQLHTTPPPISGLTESHHVRLPVVRNSGPVTFYKDEGPASLGDITFGFDINEDLLARSFSENVEMASTKMYQHETTSRDHFRRLETEVGDLRTEVRDLRTEVGDLRKQMMKLHDGLESKVKLILCVHEFVANSTTWDVRRDAVWVPVTIRKVSVSELKSKVNKKLMQLKDCPIGDSAKLYFCRPGDFREMPITDEDIADYTEGCDSSDVFLFKMLPTESVILTKSGISSEHKSLIIIFFNISYLALKSFLKGFYCFVNLGKLNKDRVQFLVQ